MQPHSTPPAALTHSAARSVYTVGAARFEYDPDDARSRHEAHAAACEELRRQNAGSDPLMERLRARRAAYAEVQALAAIHGGHAAQDAEGNVNWGSGPAKAVAL